MSDLVPQQCQKNKKKQLLHDFTQSLSNQTAAQCLKTQHVHRTWCVQWMGVGERRLEMVLPGPVSDVHTEAVHPQDTDYGPVSTNPLC